MCGSMTHSIIASLPLKNSFILVCKTGEFVIPSLSYYESGYLITKNDVPKVFERLSKGEDLSDVCVAWEFTVSMGDARGVEDFLHVLRGAGVRKCDVKGVTYAFNRVGINARKVTNYYAVFDITSSDVMSQFTASKAVVSCTVPVEDVKNVVSAINSLKDRFFKVVKEMTPKGKHKVSVVVPTEVPPLHVFLDVQPSMEGEGEDELSIEDLDELDRMWGLENTSVFSSESRAGTVRKDRGSGNEEENTSVFSGVEDVDVEELATRMMREKGFVLRTLVVFDLPSEYRGARVKIRKVGDGFEEVRVLSQDFVKFRTLRSKFYTLLRKVAWRSRMGWVLFKASKPDLREMNKVVEELNKLARLSGVDERVVEFIDVYMPRDYLVRELGRYIVEKRASFEVFKRKAIEAKERRREYRRLVKVVAEVEELLGKLEEEMRYLKLGNE